MGRQGVDRDRALHDSFTARCESHEIDIHGSRKRRSYGSGVCKRARRRSGSLHHRWENRRKLNDRFLESRRHERRLQAHQEIAAPHFEISLTDCPPGTRAAASASPAGRSHSKMFGSGIAKRIPRGVVAIAKRNISIWLPPRRFAPPLLSQEGNLNSKLRHYLQIPPLDTSLMPVTHSAPFVVATKEANFGRSSDVKGSRRKWVQRLDS